RIRLRGSGEALGHKIEDCARMLHLMLLRQGVTPRLSGTAARTHGQRRARSDNMTSMQQNPHGEPPAGDHEAPWTTWLRNGALIVVVLAMIWVVFNVDLPPVDTLQSTIESFGWAGWLFFIGLYALVALTPIPVTIMAVTGGLLFGLAIGGVLSVIGAFLGAWGAYWLARALGKQVVARMLGRYRTHVENQLTSAGFEAVCTLRLMPGLP